MHPFWWWCVARVSFPKFARHLRRAESYISEKCQVAGFLQSAGAVLLIAVKPGPMMPSDPNEGVPCGSEDDIAERDTEQPDRLLWVTLLLQRLDGTKRVVFIGLERDRMAIGSVAWA